MLFSPTGKSIPVRVKKGVPQSAEPTPCGLCAPLSRAPQRNNADHDRHQNRRIDFDGQIEISRLP